MGGEGGEGEVDGGSRDGCHHLEDPQKPASRNWKNPQKKGSKTRKPPKMAKNPITSRKSHFYGEILGVRGHLCLLGINGPTPHPPLRRISLREKSQKIPKPQKRGPPDPAIFAKQRGNKGAPLDSRENFGPPQIHPGLREKDLDFLLSKIWVFGVSRNPENYQKKLSFPQEPRGFFLCKILQVCF